MNFFRPQHEYFSGLIGVHEFFSFNFPLREYFFWYSPLPNKFSNGPSLKTVPSEDCNFSPLSVFHNSVFHISSSTKSTGVCFHLPLSIYCKIKGGNTASFRCSAFGFCKQLLLASFSQNLCICLLVQPSQSSHQLKHL